ncbi:carboxymuconolactone decarboxylase family protein [Mesorhizobium sp. B2-4-13]|uniref:carboxymuconolactone decarboxylase family protein n=1 Tax=Mesorhizobium sp. B2-4-13 TaxID=2589936 RepID=UPI00114DCB55|nr:carboxymuconolactone decarboxylase family protein [Mesorhizobium sp. B2-4-13]TPK87022.1 carboxymuconolactone decarboxylase family protein [Mesorhizobium sp. B2-4-13]
MSEQRTRLAELPLSQMTETQRTIADRILASGRSGLDGPFRIWLRSPEFADRASHLGAFVRFGTTLPSRLSELVILTVAAHWKAQFEWHAHAPIAIKAGLDSAVIQAIQLQAMPTFHNEDEKLVYLIALGLVQHGMVEDELADRALATFGETTLVELVGIAGYYTLVAFTLNLFRVEIPGNGPTPFPTSPLAEGRRTTGA